jgi:uncharacterized protein YcbX
MQAQAEGQAVNGAYLAEIASYPVKSLGGGRHDAVQVHNWGVAQDRRWMVVDPAMRFLTQREHPRMALVHAVAQDDQLLLSAPHAAPLMVAPKRDARPCKVTVWRDTVEAEDCDDRAAAWMSAAIGAPCRLVHLANTRARKLAETHALHTDEVVSFADGFPVLLASVASLADLNARLAHPVPMSRFRPNLVIADAPAWAEDTWRRVRIGGVVFRVSKPCDRCVMTTIDQQTALRPDGDEPLTTLGTFRRSTNGRIMFAQNLVPENTGSIHVGDVVQILESGSSNAGLKIVTGGLGGMAHPPQP